MAYKYHYTGEQDVELPTHKINTEGKDKDFVYETTEQINHPHFTLISEESDNQEAPVEQPQKQPVAEQPQPTEEVPQKNIQEENVSVEGGTQVESI